jgi:aldehyde dehydrogenase (NAD+)
MGGKNSMVVLADADLELAAEQAIVGAFSCAGQWCTATSRLIVEKAAYDELEHLVLERARNIAVGPGTDSSSEMGPVCGTRQLESVLAHIELAEKQGATRLLGGRQAVEGGLRNGCFVLPSIYRVADRAMAISCEEIFGPVVALESAADYEQALEMANDVRYGLSSSIFTSDLDRAVHFAEHSEVGLTHVNMHSAYKEPLFLFGGVKESGFGLPEAGSSGIQFFQEEKAVYIKR